MEERKDICEGYERDSVQQLDKLAKDKNERFPIYPLTYIQAVYDARTKERLDSILWKCNNVYLPWMGSAGDTRIQLPFWMRRKGIIITYKNLDDETITEKLTYDLCIADDFFRLDSSWTRITDALPVGGNITIGSNGNWFQDGVDSGFKAQGPKGDNGLTPMLRTVNNKLQYSYDGEVWNEISEYIAAWFRYQDNKIQISRDQKTWSDLSKPFTQDLYIKGYVATSSALPSTGVKQGDIYMVGPTYAAEDTEHKNPIYRMYVYNDSGWVDNGVFQSIAAGVVQTIGNSETEVMSQKAVSSIVGLDTYPVFSDTKPYVKGEIVNYGGLLYEFTADHEAGAWIGTDARETSLVECCKTNLNSRTDELNEVSETRNYKYSEDVVKGSNQVTKIVYTFLKAGYNYRFTITAVSGDAPINILGRKKDGTFVIIMHVDATISGTTVLVTPENDYYGFKMYYGQDSTATSVNIIFESTTKSDCLPDGMGDADNFYPDPFIMAGSNIVDLEGVLSVDIVGAPQYYTDHVILPTGSFLGVVLDLSKFTYNPKINYLNALINIETLGNGHILAVEFDDVTSQKWTSTEYLTIDPHYRDWVSFYNKTGYTTVSNCCRVTFDNRKGTHALKINRCMLWTGENVSPYGLFAKQAWNAWEKVKNIAFKTINYAPYYDEFNLQGNATNVVRTQTSLSFSTNETGDTAYIGYDFNLIDSPFKVGDIIGYGADNVVLNINPNSNSRMFCIFYSGSDELSRLSLGLRTGNFIKQYGTIPEGTTRILIRFQIMGIGTTFSVGDNYLIKGIINPSSEWERQSLKGGGSIVNTTAVVYVDAVNGNDSNHGTTENGALKTFVAAFEKTGVDTTIILIGDTTEYLNIKTKSSQRSVRIIGKRGLINRIICGTKIDKGTLLEGTTNVYQTPLASFPTATKFQLFQHEVFDEDTLIPDNERHPLQRGKSYRCDSLKITRVSSLEMVKTSGGYTFFYDTDTKILYVKIKAGTTLSTHPVYIPDGPGIYGNDGSVAFEMVNVEVWYGSASLKLCHGGRVIDCAVKYAYPDGWSWDAAIGIEFIRCEATRAFSGSTTGDGFNAHSTTKDPALAKHTVATMIDCWSHDNNDDGYSDHERCETTIIGGLFEYNVKAGLTPSYGCQDTIYNAYCRKNVNHGIALVGGTSSEEGGRGSQIFVMNCISENNKNNYYVSGKNGDTSDFNTGKFVNCASLNGIEFGYLCDDNANIELNNCTDNGSPNVKKGNITINNTFLVE